MAEKTNPEIVIDETPKKKRITFVKPTKAQLLALLSATAFGAAAGATVVTKAGNKKLRAIEEAPTYTLEELNALEALKDQED